MQLDTELCCNSADGALAQRRSVVLRQAYPTMRASGKPPACRPTACATAAAANAARLSAGFHSRIWMHGPEARRAAPSSGAGVSSPATESMSTTTTALKGLMMEKQHPNFFTPNLKSFPFSRLQEISKLSMGSGQGAMSVRAYTLYEAINRCSRSARTPAT